MTVMIRSAMQKHEYFVRKDRLQFIKLVSVHEKKWEERRMITSLSTVHVKHMQDFWKRHRKGQSCTKKKHV